MAILKSKFKYMLDEAPSITFRARDAAALTATGNSAVIALDQLDGYWNTQEELADQTFAVVANVTAADFANADETYTLGLQFGDAADFGGDNVTLTTIPVIAVGTQLVFLVDVDTVRAALPGATHMRIVATLGGTTPSLDYYAWLAGAIIR